MQANEQHNIEMEAEREQELERRAGAVLELLVPWVISVGMHVGVAMLVFVFVWVMVLDEVETGLGEDLDMVTPEMNFVAPRRMTYVGGGESPIDEPTKSRYHDLVRTACVSRVGISANMPMNDAGVTGVEMPTVMGESSMSVSLIGGVGASANDSVSFFSNGGNGRDVVFVVDTSGSLVQALPIIMHELRDSVRKLAEHQRFTVVFFQDGRVIEKQPGGLVEATDQAKGRFFKWFDSQSGRLVARGATTPRQAILRAIQYNPDIVFLLSDNITGHGRYAIDGATLVDELRQLKSSRKSMPRVCTIQFLYEDPLGTMEQIAEVTEGRYRFVDPSWVGLD